jgi:hypothetical protein
MKSFSLLYITIPSRLLIVEIKFRKVTLEMFGAAMLVSASHTALEHAEIKGINKLFCPLNFCKKIAVFARTGESLAIDSTNN